MSKEGLLIALIKSGCSFAKLYKSNSDNAEIEKTRKSFNELRDKFSRSKIKKVGKKLYRIENKDEKTELYLTELEKSLHLITKE